MGGGGCRIRRASVDRTGQICLEGKEGGREEEREIEGENRQRESWRFGAVTSSLLLTRCGWGGREGGWWALQGFFFLKRTPHFLGLRDEALQGSAGSLGGSWGGHRLQYSPPSPESLDSQTLKFMRQQEGTLSSCGILTGRRYGENPAL